MSIENARALLQQALVELADTPAVPLPPPPISTPEALDAAILAAVAGDTLTLATSLRYPAPFTLTKPLTLQSETWQSRSDMQMTIDEPAPLFAAGVTALVNGHEFLGVEMRQTDPLKTIGLMGGIGSRWDRVRVLGDPVLGAHRGIDFRGGAGVIADCYVDDIFQPAQDTQAIYSQEMLPGGGLVIDNCFLRAAGETVMFGGGDPSSEAGIPRNVTMNDCILTKKPEWVAFITATKQAQQIKCALELKNVIGFRSSGCTFEYAGVSEGQGGYLFVFTPRNQGNTAPFSTVQDVIIENFTGRFCAGVANFLGSDNVHPSGPLSGLTLRNGMVTDVDHLTLPGTTGRLFMFDRSPQNVTLDTIAVDGLNVAAAGYFTGAAPVGFVAKNMTLPPAKYGWKIDGSTGHGGSGHAALMAYMADAQLDSTVV